VRRLDDNSARLLAGLLGVPWAGTFPENARHDPALARIPDAPARPPETPAEPRREISEAAKGADCAGTSGTPPYEDLETTGPRVNPWLAAGCIGVALVFGVGMLLLAFLALR
jgi:hypothetical protein